MEILAVLQQFLMTSEDVRSRLRGGIWNNQADQNDPRPNIVLQLMGGGDGITHQGPDGLNQSTVRIYFRGDTDKDAALLAAAAARHIHGGVGLFGNIQIQLARRTQSTSDFNEPAQVQRQIDSYVVTWRYR